MMKNRVETADARISEKTIDHQIPTAPIRRGRVITKVIWNTSVRTNEMNPDISPLFNAVKNADPKIAIPAKKNEIE